MRKERIIVAASSDATPERITQRIAEATGLGRHYREWRENGQKTPANLEGNEYTLSIAESEGIYALSLKCRETGKSESIALKNGKIAIELHSSDWRQFPVTEHAKSFHILMDAGFLPAADGPLFIVRDKRPLCIDERMMIDFIPYMTGERNTIMPIVYLSLSYSTGKPAVDPAKLQKLLRGIAHVAYPENQDAADVLRNAMKDSDGKDHAPYNGTAEIIISKTNRTRSALQNRTVPEEGIYPLMNMIRTRMLTEKRDRELSYSFVSRSTMREENNVLRDELYILKKEAEDLRKNAKTASDEEINSIFDRLIAEAEKAKEKQRDAEERLQRLQDIAERRSCGCNGIQLRTPEKDLYPGEIRDIILIALRKHYESIVSGDKDMEKSRSCTVLSSILISNEYTGESDRIIEGLTKAIIAERNLSGTAKSKLRKLGFEEKPTSDGKHAKMLFFGDERYSIALSITPSDIKTRKNEISRIQRLLFPM